MPSTLAAYGLRPLTNPAGSVRPHAITSGISATYSTALYKGTPVKMATGATAAGVVQIAAASGAAWIGAFAGVQYTDANGRMQYVNSWAASTAVATGTTPTAFIWDDPGILYSISMDGGSKTQVTTVGQQFNFSAVSGYAVTDGNSTTQQSTTALANAGAGATTQGAFRVTDIDRQPDNAWGDTYVMVVGNVAQHQYLYPIVGL